MQALSLSDLTYGNDGVLGWTPRQESLPLTALQEHMRDGEAVLTSAANAAVVTSSPEMASVNTDFDALRWFDLPRECFLPEATPSPRSGVSSSPTLYGAPAEVSSPQTSLLVHGQTQAPLGDGFLSPGTPLMEVVTPNEVDAVADALSLKVPQLSRNTAHVEYQVADSIGVDRQNKPMGRARRKLGLLSLFNHHDMVR